MGEGMLGLLGDARRARKGGPAALRERQRVRLAALVGFACARSPYYRRLYGELPDRVEDPPLLPITIKAGLMARFDEWVTDPEVTLENVQVFVDNPALVGERFLERYTATTTSGTTGSRGIFLIDDRSLRVTKVLALRKRSSWLGARDVANIIWGGRRLAMVMAAGGHFASAIAAARLARGLGKSFLALPVETPLSELVERLNAFPPAILAPYASDGALLASEAEAGRLRIKPVLVVLSAEGFAPGEYGRIARAFGATVRDSYAATECPFLSRSGGQVSLPPLLLAALVDHVPGVSQVQIVQTAPDALRVRVRLSTPGPDAAQAWRAIEADLRRVLAKHGLDSVRVERGAEPPEPSPGGKVRTVLPFKSMDGAPGREDVRR